MHRRLPDDHLHVDGLKIKAGTSFSLGSIEIVQAEILIHFSYAYVFSGRNVPPKRFTSVQPEKTARIADIPRFLPTGLLSCSAIPIGFDLWRAPAAIARQARADGDRPAGRAADDQGPRLARRRLPVAAGPDQRLRLVRGRLRPRPALSRLDPHHRYPHRTHDTHTRVPHTQLTLGAGTPGRDNCWLKASIPASKPNPQTVSGAKGLLRTNRTLSSLYPKADRFPEFGPLLAPTGPDGWAMRNLTLHIFVDHSIVEVFVNQGKERLTSRVYPTLPDSRFAELFVGGPHDVFVTSIDVWQLRTIWL